MEQDRDADHDELLRELAPSARLRVGVVVAPARSALFAVRDEATGDYTGVTVDLGRALAHQLGVAPEICPFPNSGACTTALESGLVDVTFLPVDDERRSRVAFGPAYYVIESTYLIAGASGIETLADVDHPEVRVVGITNTTTIRSSTRTLRATKPDAVDSIAEAVDRLKSGRANALALSRDAFRTLLPQLPGAYVLDGGFQSTSVAVAVRRNSTTALRYVSAFLENAKRSGLVRRALDAAGFPTSRLPPQPFES